MNFLLYDFTFNTIGSDSKIFKYTIFAKFCSTSSVWHAQKIICGFKENSCSYFSRGIAIFIENVGLFLGLSFT